MRLRRPRFFLPSCTSTRWCLRSFIWLRKNSKLNVVSCDPWVMAQPLMFAKAWASPCIYRPTYDTICRCTGETYAAYLKVWTFDAVGMSTNTLGIKDEIFNILNTVHIYVYMYTIYEIHYIIYYSLWCSLSLFLSLSPSQWDWDQQSSAEQNRLKLGCQLPRSTRRVPSERDLKGSQSETLDKLAISSVTL